MQYTIRNIPPQLDRALRKRAALTGKSLNQIVVEDIAAQNNILPASDTGLLASLSWFVGSGA